MSFVQGVWAHDFPFIALFCLMFFSFSLFLSFSLSYAMFSHSCVRYLFL